MTPHTVAGNMTPEQFLQLAEGSEPGWSAELGGPLGVAALCAGLQQQLAEQSAAIAAVRTAAIRQLLEAHSGVEVAAMLGVSKNAISKTNRAQAWEDATW